MKTASLLAIALLMSGCQLLTPFSAGSQYSVELPDGTKASAKSTSNSDAVELTYTADASGVTSFSFKKNGTDNTNAVTVSGESVGEVSGVVAEALERVFVPQVLP